MWVKITEYIHLTSLWIKFLSATLGITRGWPETRGSTHCACASQVQSDKTYINCFVILVSNTELLDAYHKPWCNRETVVFIYITVVSGSETPGCKRTYPIASPVLPQCCGRPLGMIDLDCHFVSVKNTICVVNGNQESCLFEE